MLPLSILILALLAVGNFLLSKKVLFPPVVFCSVWAADLVIVWLAGDFFYKIRYALTLYCLGAFVFSIGAAACLVFRLRGPRSVACCNQRLLSCMVGLTVVSVPFLYRWISSGTDVHGFSGTIFALARQFMLTTQEEGGGFQFTLYSNLAAFSIPVAMLAFAESEYSKKRAAVAIVASVAMNVLIGGRAGLAILVLCCFCIHVLTGHKITIKSLAVLVLSGAFILGVMAVVLSKGDTATSSGLSETASAVKDQAYLYVAGGAVGFDDIVNRPSVIPHNWNIWRFPLQLASALGFKTEIPPLHAEYDALGPHGLIGNVYTLYFAYVDLGTIGTLGVLMFLGAICGFYFSRAIAGHRVSLMVYAMMFSGLALSISGEYFFMGIPFLVRTASLTWIAYDLSPVSAAHRRTLGDLVDRYASANSRAGFRGGIRE